MNSQFEKNFALAKRHEPQLIACLEDYFGTSFSPAELGEDKYRKIDFISECRQFTIGARVQRHTGWKYRAQVSISDNKSIHKSEHDEWMVESKGPDYFIYGHIAPDGKALQMIVLVSLPMLRTIKGKRLDNHNFFVYPITDPGIVLCCWCSSEVRDDPIIKILSGSKKTLQPLSVPTSRGRQVERSIPNIPRDLSADTRLPSDKGRRQAEIQRQSRRNHWYSAIVAVLLISGVVSGIYLHWGMAQTETGAKKQTELTTLNLIAPEHAMAHFNQIGTVCGEVASSMYATSSKGRPTYLNIDKPYPDHIFSAVIWDEYRAQFGIPEQRYKEKWICVTGRIIAYQGVAQIEVQEREQLNEVDEPTFKYFKKLFTELPEPNLIAPEDAMTHLGQIGTVCGEVASSMYATSSKGRPTYLNIGKPYPNHIFSAVIWDTHRAKFGALEQRYKGKWICVRGRIADYRGAAQIEVQEREQLNEVNKQTFKYFKNLFFDMK